jgi:hypothetical protein
VYGVLRRLVCFFLFLCKIRNIVICISLKGGERFHCCTGGVESTYNNSLFWLLPCKNPNKIGDNRRTAQKGCAKKAHRRLFYKLSF